MRQIRQEARLRQVEMAQRLGKPQAFVSKYETLERRLDLLGLQDVCEAAGISLEGFVRRFDEACRRQTKRASS